MDWGDLGNYAVYIIIGIIALISWVVKALRRSQQQQKPQQRRSILHESTAETPPAEQMPTTVERVVQQLFGIEEHEEREEQEEVVEAPKPEPEPAPAAAPEEKPAPSEEKVTPAPESPEDMRKKLGEIMGMPLNPQNIRYGIIFSEILKRRTPRRLRD